MPLAEPVIDRRSFISGRIAEPDRVVAPPGAEIASVLVQARADRLAEVEAAILAIGGCEIHARDPKGKLVVVIEASNAGALGATLTAIALLPSVFSASLVFHAIDAAASGESS